MQDSFGRKIEYLRVSVTDKCNLRCRYCMPQEGITRLAHDDILRLEEWARIIRIMQELGITKVRFTGGEPLVRKNLIQLIKDVHALDGISQIAMTTNGILLGEQAADLREAGLTHVNISLDTLNPRTFEEITRVDALNQVLSSIEKALQAGLQVKINWCALSGMERRRSDRYCSVGETVSAGCPFHRTDAGRLWQPISWHFF